MTVEPSAEGPFSDNDIAAVTHNKDFLESLYARNAARHVEAGNDISDQIKALELNREAHALAIGRFGMEAGNDKKRALENLSRYSNGLFRLSGLVIVVQPQLVGGLKTCDTSISGGIQYISDRNVKDINVKTGEVFNAWTRLDSEPNIRDSIKVSPTTEKYAAEEYRERLKQKTRELSNVCKADLLLVRELTQPFLPAVEIDFIEEDDMHDLEVIKGRFSTLYDKDRFSDGIAYLADVNLYKIEG